jgi:hypothetical protein
MASKRASAPAAAGLSEASDDFKLIIGIGPAIERLLHDGGIHTFAQLAALSSLEIAVLVDSVKGMSAERIENENWIGQARELAPASTEFHHRATSTGNRQHYATFTIELLLDEDNVVRRTRIVHIQDGDEDTWAGWKETRMVGFVRQHAALQLPAAEPSPPVTATAEPAPPRKTPARLGGVLSLQALEAAPPDAASPRSILRHDQPFNVRITLDLTEVVVSDNGPFDYTAAVYAKNLGGGPRQTVGEAHGTITPKDQPTITMEGKPLPRGIYRLEAVSTLTLPLSELGLTARLEGNLLQIY